MKTSKIQLLELARQRMLNTLFHYLPLSFIEAAYKSARYLLPFINWRINVYELRGKGINGGDNLVTLCVGEGRWACYVPERIYSEEPTRKKVATVLPWNLPRKLASLSPHADLIVVRTDVVSGELLFSEDYFTIPEWIASTLIVPESMTDLSKVSHSVKDDLRVMRKRGFSFVVSHEDSDFGKFYETMYVPYIVQRHGSLAMVRTFDQLKRRFDREGGLLFVEWKGQHIAGVLYTVQGETFSFLLLGVKDADFGYVRMGAIAALYYSAISWAQKLGCEQMDFGGSRPFLDDGVFRYKRKWGMRVEGKKHNMYVFILRVCNFNSETRSFLASNPFIFKDGRDLSALAFVDTDHPIGLGKVRRLYKDYWTPGLKNLFCLSPSGLEETADNGGSTLPRGTVLISPQTVQGGPPRVVGASSDTIPKAVLSLLDGHW
jgi:hypothetical protein